MSLPGGSGRNRALPWQSAFAGTMRARGDQFLVLIALIALHIGAVLLHRALKRDNLILPMITGRKRADAPAPMRFASNWLALFLFAVVALAAIALSRYGE